MGDVPGFAEQCGGGGGVSFCRFSSDDFQCDVYVYEDVRGGFTTHVAERRYAFAEPLPPHVQLTEGNVSAWMSRDATMEEIMARTPLVEIGLEHDGETFNDDTAGECANRLESLRSLGYIVPQYAIDALRNDEEC
jgi:hypothetical protein